MPRIAVFSGDLSFAVRKGIIEIDRRVPGVEWLLAVHTPPRTLKRLIRNQWANLRMHGWRWIFYQAKEICARLLRRDGESGLRLIDPVEPKAPGFEYSYEQLLTKPNVKCFKTADLHAPQALQQVRTFAPDLGLALAAPVLKPALFEIPRLGTLNLHKGRVPHYRGMPPAFWELWNDEASIGCTVHRVSAGLDQGDVVEETSIPRQRYSTVKGLQLTLDEVGIELTCRAAQRVLAGDAKFEPQPAGGTTYRKPMLKQIAQLRQRLLAQWPSPVNGPLRKLAKTVFLLCSLFVGRARLSLFSKKPAVTVILYHRVSDDLRDSLTTGIEQFDRHMAMIRKYCYAVSIEDLVSGRFPKNASRPLVCVTFDDGYRDNYTAAVPALLRHRIPAGFFVSTGFIGTSKEFPHDEGKVPMQLDKMSWDDLRHMKELGFVIGSHTVNHIDCAKEPEETVRRELQASLAGLRNELGVKDVILAYPFGGKSNMTPERLDMVKQAGYVGCLSAYGGFNRGTVDRYNVLRCGVNWSFSDLAFRCRIAGIR
jgi:peptidoglycan/xylan/chitin deacetylase (PgdA/CDA1 family)/folate-dependent phosphoribosylglycinamide formyltransferase PurN